jgi:hypothetical protein
MLKSVLAVMWTQLIWFQKLTVWWIGSVTGKSVPVQYDSKIFTWAFRVIWCGNHKFTRRKDARLFSCDMHTRVLSCTTRHTFSCKSQCNWFRRPTSANAKYPLLLHWLHQAIIMRCLDDKYYERFSCLSGLKECDSFTNLWLVWQAT